MTPTASKLNSFEDSLRTDVTLAVSTVAQAAAHGVLTGQQLADLSAVLKEAYPDVFSHGPISVEDPGYGADFDMTEVVNDQITIFRSLKQNLMEDNGALKDKVSSRDIQSLISSGGTLLQNLMRSHEKILTYKRAQDLEAATIEAVKTLPVENQQIFFETLEDALARRQA